MLIFYKPNNSVRRMMCGVKVWSVRFRLPGQGKKLSFTNLPGPALEPTQRHVQGVTKFFPWC